MVAALQNRKCGGKEFLEVLGIFRNHYYSMKGQEEPLNTR